MVALTGGGKSSTPDLHAPSRPPLIPSEKDNATTPSRSRDSSSTSTSTCTSTSTSSSSAASRRYPSPLMTSTPQPTLPLSRSRSADRSRTRRFNAPPTSTGTSTSSNSGRTNNGPDINLCTTTTRSLSVSFQGESFFIQTRRSRPSTPGTAPVRKPTPERRRHSSFSENSRPIDRWPASIGRPRQPNPLARSLDCSLEKKDSILATVHLLHQSMENGGDLSVSSDTDSVSSGSNSNSGTHDFSFPSRAKATPRGISVPARFWQETNSRLRRFTDPNPSSKPLNKKPPSSPSLSKTPSPSKTRTGSPGPASITAPSIINFANEVRRARKGEGRIEEAHKLRLLDNRFLQWRFVNGRAWNGSLTQRLNAEKNLYNAWRCTSELRDAVAIKRMKLQLLTQRIKLTSILRGQISYLEEWSVIEKDHSSSLSDATESLKASTLRLPIVNGAKAEIQEVKEVVGTAVDVMNSMVISICSLLSKVQGAGSLVSELAKIAAQEKSLLDQSRDLLSTVSVLNVKKCSLQGQIIQRIRKQGQIHL